MRTNIDYVYDAIHELEQLSRLNITIESRRSEYDGLVDIDGNSFAVEARNELRRENKGLLIARLEELKTVTNRPILVIAKYIHRETALELKELGINYLDIAGNTYIKQGDLLIYITGQTVDKTSINNPTKILQEAGIKIIFNLLSNPQNIQLPYRELASISDVSVGSVANVMRELQAQHYILKTKQNRVLKRQENLLERWVIAYHEILRPKLIKKQMHFVKKESITAFQTLLPEVSNEIVLWGGEAAASILTEQLIPEILSVYTTESWQNIGQLMNLVPDENYQVEILQVFWKEQYLNDDKRIVPPLLIYADLMGSGYGRNIEIAKIILENELPHIQ